MSMSETPKTLPRAYCLTCPHSKAFWKKSYTAAARCTSMGDEPRCTFEKCKTRTMTRSSIYTSPIVCVRGESSDQQGSFVQCTRSEQLSAVSTFERVHCVDISHDKFGHPNLVAVQSRDRFDGRERFKEILRNPTLDFISINHFQILIVQAFELAPGDARTNHLFHHA